jgi:hypothetical protein
LKEYSLTKLSIENAKKVSRKAVILM